MRIDPGPPFFRAFHALAVDDGGGGTGVAFALFPALHILRVMDAIERSVVAPQLKIVEQRRPAWRHVLRHRAPLASPAQSIHDPVHHFANVDRALAAGLRWRDQPTVGRFPWILDSLPVGPLFCWSCGGG